MYVKTENLWVAQLAGKLAASLMVAVRKWHYNDYKVIGSQLVRAAYSIGANLVEGRGRSTPADSLRFYYIARGSLEETKYWIRQASAAGLMEEKNAAFILGQYQRLFLALNAFIAAHKSRNRLP